MIAAVLSVILVANALVSRFPKLCDLRVAYAALLVSLLTCANVSVETLLSWPLAHVIVTMTYTSPLLFAGVIFAHAFRNTAHPMRALGSNLLGSLLGGFLELASFAFGLTALLYLAAMLYAFSYPLRARSKHALPTEQVRVPRGRAGFSEPDTDSAPR